MEKGLVVDTQNNKMTIRLASSEACKSCGGCLIKDGQAILEDIENSVSAQKGDTVIIENKPANVITAASIIYLIPVVALIGGYFSGLLLVNLLQLAEKFAVLIALAIFTCSFFLISIIDKRFAKNSNFKPVVVKKL